MEQTTQFTQQKINDLFDANFFGDDAYAQDIQKLWIRRMHELGFELGNLTIATGLTPPVTQRWQGLSRNGITSLSERQNLRSFADETPRRYTTHPGATRE